MLSNSFVIDFSTVIIDRDLKEDAKLITDQELVKEFGICSLKDYESDSLSTVLKPPAGCTESAQSERVQLVNEINSESTHGIEFDQGECDYFALYDLLVYFFDSCKMQIDSEIVIFVQNESKMKYLLAFEPVVRIYFNYPLIRFCNLGEAGFSKELTNEKEDDVKKRFGKCSGIMQANDKHKSCSLQLARYMAHWIPDNTVFKRVPVGRAKSPSLPTIAEETGEENGRVYSRLDVAAKSGELVMKNFSPNMNALKKLAQWSDLSAVALNGGLQQPSSQRNPEDDGKFSHKIFKLKEDDGTRVLVLKSEVENLRINVRIVDDKKDESKKKVLLIEEIPCEKQMFVAAKDNNKPCDRKKANEDENSDCYLREIDELRQEEQVNDNTECEP